MFLYLAKNSLFLGVWGIWRPFYKEIWVGLDVEKGDTFIISADLRLNKIALFM